MEKHSFYIVSGESQVFQNRKLGEINVFYAVSSQRLMNI